MTEPTDAPPRPTPGEAVPPAVRRTLERPPSERYRTAPADDDADATRGSLARAVAGSVVAAIAGAALLVLLASGLAVVEPLVVVALALGLGAGLAARLGGGTAVERRRRRLLAVGLALGAVFGAELVDWAYALGQGGVLAFPDYELQTFGPVAILEPVAAALAAWAAA